MPNPNNNRLKLSGSLTAHPPGAIIGAMIFSLANSFLQTADLLSSEEAPLYNKSIFPIRC